MGFTQVCVFQMGSPQVRVLQMGSPQVCLFEMGEHQIRVVEIGLRQIRALEEDRQVGMSPAPFVPLGDVLLVRATHQHFVLSWAEPSVAFLGVARRFWLGHLSPFRWSRSVVILSHGMRNVMYFSVDSHF